MRAFSRTPHSRPILWKDAIDRKAAANGHNVSAAPPPHVEAYPPAPPVGGHPLPLRFSADAHSPSTYSPAPPPARRRPPKALLLSLGGGVLVIAALAITQLIANLGYDGAASRYETAAQTATDSAASVREDTTATRSTTEAAGQILSTQNRTLPLPPELEAGLAAAVDEGAAATSRADGVLATEIPAAISKPVWFWELFGSTTLLDEHRDVAEGLSEDLQATTVEMRDAGDALTASGLAAVTAAGTAAADFEAAHLSARNDAVISLRNAAADALTATTVDDTTATTYLALQEAAAQVVTTEAAELAEKSGPLQGARLEIEAFARSLAPGVLLDFDWAPVVSGAGYNGSMGGYTTWWWDDPGRATIELSDSVAEQWPAERSKALVAHEVGHAISVKCQGMYDASTQDSIEKWATAWAISMGFTDDANGVWAYGFPPQDYIDAAAGCR